MQNRSLILFAAITIYVGNPGNALADSWPHEIIDAMDGERLILFLRDEEIAASPQWLPAQEDAPPMSIAEAVRHLKAWLVTDERYRNASIHEIELKPIKNHEQEHRWYYLVQLRHRVKGRLKALYAAVLFDGTVLPVLVEPESIK